MGESLELVVLGASGTYPAPGSACSGYLFRYGGASVWVDAGPGTFANLQRHADPAGLSALILSHAHLDHICDFFPFYYALRFGRGAAGPRGLPVYAPEGVSRRLAGLISDSGEDCFAGYFAFQSIRAGDALEIGGMHLRFAASLHPVETLAVRAEAGGKSAVYTADTGYTQDVVDLAAGADLLVAEATLQEADPALAAVHMTGQEAGEMARTAGAGRLVLAHIPPGLDRSLRAAQAGERYGGEILLAADNLKLEV